MKKNSRKYRAFLSYLKWQIIIAAIAFLVVFPFAMAIIKDNMMWFIAYIVPLAIGCSILMDE
jgi:hypothetical protein